MAINYEIKSQLAKLLATEDLIVENKQVATAQFNIETRVLTLPMWKRASNSVYDMLVGHEVGHALFTPDEWDWQGTVPQQFVNVTEDARIEKLMKRKYPGLHKSFNAGYEELAEEDFFCLDGEDIDSMNLADKANLFFKIGKYIDITFTDEEKVIVEQIGDAETFDEAVEAAKVMYEYCKKPKEDSQPIVTPPKPGGSSGGQQEGETQQTESSGESDDIMTHEEMLEEAASRESVDEPEENLPEPEVTTDSTFEERKEEFNGNLDTDSLETGYHELPEFNVDDLIVPFSEIRTKFDMTEELFMKEEEKAYVYVDAEYAKFKKSAQKEVNFLVKEFECKKAADSYSRAATSRTGVLDCTKLHTYKYNEDLFKKVTILPDGKNHGLIFILDWSGSMGNCILDTLKQLYNLIWFCNKCNIPFDVYAFTNSYLRGRGDDEERFENMWQEDRLLIHGDFRLMNFFSSREKKKDIEKQMQSLFRLVWSMKTYCFYSYPPEFSLSGTPLNETLIALTQIIPAFKKMHGLQKTHCFILTDGEANPLMVAKENSYGGKGSRHLIADHSFIRNRKTGHTYQVKRAYHAFSKILLENLKEENKDCNFVGIRLCAPREMNAFIRSYQHVTDDALKQIKRQKYYEIKNTGYTSYFAMQSNALNQESEFDVEDGASKAKIKSAFVKNLKTKALNKKVLSKFMELVA